MCGDLKDAVRDYLRFKAEQEAAHAEWRDNDALMFPLLGNEDLIRCDKTPEGRVTVFYPQGASKETGFFFNRLCALRSAEY